MKKILSMTLVMVMALSLFTVIPVSATTITRVDVIPVTMIDGDAVTLSVDVTITGENEHGYWFIFSSPINASKPWDIQNDNRKDETQFRITPYGTFRYKHDGKWIDENGGGSLEAPDIDFSDGLPHNVKLRLYQKASERWGEWYVDDVFVAPFKTATSNIITNINVLGYPSDGNTFKVDVKHCMNSNAGHLAAIVSDVDQENNQIVVDFSEMVEDSSLLEKAVLKNTDVNSTQEIPLSMLVATGATAVYNYSGTLDDSAEYALIFPQGIKSVVHVKDSYPQTVLEDRIIYFNTEKWTTLTDENFETGASGFYSAVLTDGKTYRTKEDDNWGVNISRVSDNSHVIGMKGYTLPTGNVQKVSIDLKPASDAVYGWFELEGGSQNISIGYGNGYVVANKPATEWPSHGWLTQTGYPFYTPTNVWTRERMIGTYSANVWDSWEFVYDKVINNVKIYRNGEIVKDLAVGSGFGNIKSVRFWASTTGTKGDDMFRVDNFKIEELVSDVKNVTFIDEADKEYMPLNTVKKPVKSVKIEFSGNIDETNLSGITLMQGETIIPASGSYDKNTYTYTLTPTVETLPNLPLYAVVNATGVDGNTISYKTYVNSASFTEGFVNFIDADTQEKDPVTLTAGKTYKINAFGTSYSSSYLKMFILAAQYDDLNRLIGVTVNPVLTAEKGVQTGIYSTDAEPLSITVKDNADRVGVFIWTDNYKPWCNTRWINVN